MGVALERGPRFVQSVTGSEPLNRDRTVASAGPDQHQRAGDQQRSNHHQLGCERHGGELWPGHLQ